MYTTPIMEIRRNHLINSLIKFNACSEETALTLEEAGVFDPAAFKGVARLLVSRGIIGKTEDNKYYII